MHTASANRVLAFLAPQGLATGEAESFAAPAEIVWIPAGETTISAGGGMNGEGFVGSVRCDEQAAAAIAASYAATVAAGLRVWLDFDHDDGEAAAWVTGFRWDASRGIVASVAWTDAGLQALKGKAYYSFSPAFLIDRETSRPCSLIEGHAAGGLVNAPAFGARMPALIAARLGGTPTLVATATATVPAVSGIQTSDTRKTMSTVNASAAVDAAPATDVKASDDAVSTPSLADVMKAVEAIAAKVSAMEPAKDAPVSAKSKPVAPEMPATAPVAPVIAATPNLIESVRAYGKAHGKDRSKIYAATLSKQLGGNDVMQVLAANSLGSLAGDLILQRSLTLLKLKFPLLSAISTDFSDSEIKLNQAVRSRIRTIPTATDYNTTTGYAASDATTTDVAVTIDQHKAVMIEFNANEVASTGRDLFGEQAEGASYAIGKTLVDALYARITAGNFSTATVQAVGGFGRATMVKIAKALTARGGADVGRFALLNQDYYEALSNDSTILNLAAYQKPELITGYSLPPIATLQPYEAVNLPTTGNLTGFAGTADALVIATRLPGDYIGALPGAGNGSSSVVTNPDTGVSVQLVNYVDHKLGKAVWRAAFMFGTAPGQAASGQRLVSV